MEFLVERREFLVRGLEFLLRRFEFLVRALQFLVARERLLIRRAQLLVGSLVLLHERVKRLLRDRQFLAQLRQLPLGHGAMTGLALRQGGHDRGRFLLEEHEEETLLRRRHLEREHADVQGKDAPVLAHLHAFAAGGPVLLCRPRDERAQFHGETLPRHL